VLTIAVGSSHAQMPPIGCRCKQHAIIIDSLLLLTIAVGSSHAQMPPIGCRCEQLPSAYEKS